MKTIELTESQREALCYELAYIVNQYEKFEQVECIYAMPFESEYAHNDQLSVVIVRKVNGERYLENHIDYYNDRTKKKKQANCDKYGVELLLSYDDASEYTGAKYHMSKEGYLLNSTILFDRTGYYKGLQLIEAANDTLAFINSCGFVPPLDSEKEPTGLRKDATGRRLVFVKNKPKQDS